MTDSVFRAVAPVSAVCAAFRTQPSAYPPNTRKPDVARCAGALRERQAQKETACGRFSAEEKPQAAKQDNAAGSCAPLGSHIYPPCGQFRGFTKELLSG